MGQAQVGPLLTTIIGVAPKGFVGVSEAEAPERVRPDHDDGVRRESGKRRDVSDEVQLGLDERDRAAKARRVARARATPISRKRSY